MSLYQVVTPGSLPEPLSQGLAGEWGLFLGKLFSIKNIYELLYLSIAYIRYICELKIPND
jgi:hypothetical protein